MELSSIEDDTVALGVGVAVYAFGGVNVVNSLDVPA
jgi:hypothetical protein